MQPSLERRFSPYLSYSALLIVHEGPKVAENPPVNLLE